MELQTIVNKAAWTHNTSVNVKGFTPMMIVTGKAVMQPDLSQSDTATSVMSDSEAVKKVISRMHKIHEEFMKCEYFHKLENMGTTRTRNYHSKIYKEGDKVFYQLHSGKSWHGPMEIFRVDGNKV